MSWFRDKKNCEKLCKSYMILGVKRDNFLKRYFNIFGDMMRKRETIPFTLEEDCRN